MNELLASRSQRRHVRRAAHIRSEPEEPGSVTALPVASPGLDTARAVTAELFGEHGTRAFGIRYWNGFEEPAAAGTPTFTLVLRSPGALRRMLFPPSELALGEAFVRGDFDIEGDIEAAVALGARIATYFRSPRRALRLALLLVRRPRGDDRGDSTARPDRRARERVAGVHHSRERDAEAIRFHYDVGNDFYGLWLDARRVYSCGYFPTGHEDIGEAQLAKLRHICRKLRLGPGERLLDIGCGWGGLVRYAARHYGVEALGVTLSPAQAEFAQQAIQADGLADRCRVEVRDYRDLPRGKTFDKVVSVGMFEHVGPEQLAGYFDAAFRLTAPGGLFLNHGIVSLEGARPMNFTRRLMRRIWRRGEFLDRYVFPDGELVTLADLVQQAEAAGFETRDTESLREHYAETLRHWVRRLEARHEDAVTLAGEHTYRVWRLYMAASAHAFTAGRIGVVQALLARADAGGRCRMPRTREDIYWRWDSSY